MIRSRLNRIRFESQQQNLTTVTKHISGLKLEQTSVTITTVSNSSSVINDHTNAHRGEASRIRQTIQNPVQRFDFALSAGRAVQDVANNLSGDKGKISWPLANPELDSSALSFPNETLRRSKQQTWTKDIRYFVTQTFLGTITITTTTTTTTTTRPRLSRLQFIDDDHL